MAKSQQTFNKQEKEKKRLKKREDKKKKQEERKANPKSSEFDDMIAYVDEFGNISDTPPDPKAKRKISAKSIEVSTPKRGSVVVDPVRKGKIDFFDHTKGFGFIMEHETQERFFVHVNGCTEEVSENDKVSFELEKGLKGMNAVRVKKV